ncbi:DMT family transporter [Nocardiopsis kunsanensis]|uniref:Membrane protein n=1 Tax=Nocardiopsis kunsanensis TaxID=141693 RepID=A0A918XBJ0_9ACTN|nr:DMT family transporter [Nocardiopsis kunsanensis]GHD23859.1 membrane protein [Nocardiopsis kunsanensis]
MASSPPPSARPPGPTTAEGGAAQRGFVLLVFAGVLWGTGGPAAAVLQTDHGLSSMSAAVHRLLIAGVVIGLVLLFAGRLHRTAWSRPLVGRLLLNGVLHAGFQLLYFASLALIPVGLATLVKIGSVPVFVTAGVCLTARRRPTVVLTVPVVLAVVGLSLLAGFPSTDVPPAQVAAGLTCALGAGLAFSVMGLVNRRPVEGLDALTNAGLGMLLGGVLLLPAALVFGVSAPLGPQALGLLLFLGLVPTVLAYLSYFTGLRTASDTGVAVGTIAEPLTAALLSAALLGEQMTAAGLVGAAVLVASMGAEPVMRRVERRRGRTS